MAAVEVDDGTELEGVEVHAVELTGAGDGRVEDVEIRASRLVGVSLTGAAFDRLRLTDVVLQDCELSGVTLADARFERVEMRACRASGLVAPGLVAHSFRAIDCRLDQACTPGARFERATFDSCDLRDADLSGAVLTGDRMVDCDLSHAQMSGVRADGLALHGSRLDRLQGAGSLRGALIGPDQIVDLAMGLFAAMRIQVADPAYRRGPHPTATER